jgi:predicted permease
VKSASLAAVPLLSGDEWDSSTAVEGHTFKDGEDQQAFMNSISPGYFATMGIPIKEGRDFDRRDMHDHSKVAIVNEQFARHFFGDKSAVGRHLGRGGGPGTKLDIEIIGVSANSLYEGPREGVRRQVFIPNWGNGGVAFYVRAAIGSSSAYGALRNEVKKLDASMPVYSLKTLGSQLDETLLTERLIALLSAGFGLLATLLAAIGLYGVMSFTVARRTKEMGVRMALGAQPATVIWLVMKEVLVLLALGLAVGIPAAIGLGRFVATQLYGIKASDPWIGGASMLMLILVAVVAGLIPAQRASRIDPILALRYE